MTTAAHSLPLFLHRSWRGDPQQPKYIMPFSSRLLAATALCFSLLLNFACSHTVITYPGWRGDNLITNGTIPEAQGLGIGPDTSYPYGMQWMYPCKCSRVSSAPISRDCCLFMFSADEVSRAKQAAVCPCLPIAPSGP